jgi:hypothetical protein
MAENVKSFPDLSMGSGKEPSIVKDPFKRDNVTAIFLAMSKRHGDEWTVWGTVEFKNGSTEGKQRFTAETLEELAAQVKSFLETL